MKKLSAKKKTLAFLLPSLLGVLGFFIIPFGIVVFYSVIDNNTTMNFVGFNNFVQLFKNTSFQLALNNTLMFSAIAVPLAIILPLLFSLLLAEKLPARSFFRTVFLSPLMVPVASVVLIFQVIFAQNGALNSFTQMFGAEAIDWLKSDYSRYIIVLLFLWKNIGYNMILFMSALGGIPAELSEAAKIDGAGSVRRFFRIKLPYLFSSIIFVGIMSLINSFKIFREVYLLTGDYPYDALYLLQHYMNNMFTKLQYQRLSSAAVVICIIMAIIIGILLFVDSRLSDRIEE
jgi:multiple sugar transport system permease protein